MGCTGIINIYLQNTRARTYIYIYMCNSLHYFVSIFIVQETLEFVHIVVK